MMNIEEKYEVPPYQAAQYVKRAQSIVSKAVNDSTSFLQPYTETKIVLEIALAIAIKNCELFKEAPKL